MIQKINDLIHYSEYKVVEFTKSTKTLMVANRAFAEIAASFVFNVGLVSFASTPLSVSAISLATIHLGFNLCAQRVYQIYQNRMNNQENVLSSEPGHTLSCLSSAFFVGRAGPQIFFHEHGHALMANACFKNAHPKISIKPFWGGVTSYTISNGLTAFGKVLGKERSLVLIAASGMMASTVLALMAFATAESLRDHYPNIAQFLDYEGISFILSEVLYGLSAFISCKDDLRHDFINIWKKGGIHPLIPIVLMISLPLVEVLLLRASKSYKEAQSRP